MNRLLPLILLLTLLNGGGFAYSLLIIDSQNAEPYITVREAMLDELEKRGFILDQNLSVKVWSLANSDGMAQRAWMTENDKDYDLIFINGTIAAQNFRDFALGDMKYRFLFGAVTDPVGLGLIRDFEHNPYSNFTGIAYPVQIRERLRFMMRLFPEAREVGFIYGEMSQSESYVKWLDEILKEKEFSRLRFHYRSVEFIRSESGHIRMAMLAEKHIRELDPVVHIFLAPNDQMGVQSDFVRTVSRLSGKPLVGLGRADVMDGWGAVASIYPALDEMGSELAEMAEQLLKGKEIKDIIPRWPPAGVAFNLQKAEKLGIAIPDDLLKSAGENIIR